MEEVEYQKLIEDTRAWYKTIGKVYCPALKADVIFNAKGFYHLLYDGTGTARTVRERTRRLKLVRQVVPIIQNSGSVFRTRAGVSIMYYVLKKGVILVVIRKKDKGGYFYHSVMDK